MITSYHYPNEATMRGANPYLADLLSNKATLQDGLYTAIENGRTYTWNARAVTPATDNENGK